MYIEYIRVPYWRTLRPRWIWMMLGFITGFAMGVFV